MNWTVSKFALSAALLLASGSAFAAGELHFYNWGNYTNPALIEKFEQTYDVKVSLTDYDSNDTALAKIMAGASGFDMVVPTHYYIPIYISEGLLLETRPDQMENFANLHDKFKNPDFDPGRRYSVPWQWGTTGVIVNTKYYSGDIDTWGIVFDTPDELKGKVNVVPEMNDVMAGALFYKGFSQCNSNKDELREVRDMLLEAKKDWLSLDFGILPLYVKEDLHAGVLWNGPSMRARLENDSIAYGYPKEGMATWMDSVVVLKDAQNVENAKLFQNFIMDPEIAALISEFAKFANGIKGSEAFLSAEFAASPEISPPAHYTAVFVPACPPEVNDLYTKIWTELLK